jgi:hypothetical protein
VKNKQTKRHPKTWLFDKRREAKIGHHYFHFRAFKVSSPSEIDVKRLGLKKKKLDFGTEKRTPKFVG